MSETILLLEYGSCGINPNSGKYLAFCAYSKNLKSVLQRQVVMMVEYNLGALGELGRFHGNFGESGYFLLDDGRKWES